MPPSGAGRGGGETQDTHPWRPGEAMPKPVQPKGQSHTKDAQVRSLPLE